MKYSSTSKLTACLLIILYALSGCQQHESDIEPMIISSEAAVLSGSEIPGLTEALAPYINPALSRDNIQGANQLESYFGLDINFEEIFTKMDAMGQVHYSMALEDNDDDPKTFQNLVIKKSTDGQFLNPFLMTYTMSDEFFQEYLHSGSMANFTGKIKRAYLLPIAIESQRSGKSPAGGDPGDYGSDRDQPNTTCEEETVISSQQGVTTTSPSGAGNVYTVCEVVVTTFYTEDQDGVRTDWFEIVTYENCRTEESNTSSDSENCPNDDGEVPVNTSNLLEIIRILLEHPCADEIFKEIESSEIEGLRDIIDRFANEDSEFQYTVGIGNDSNIDADKDAQTRWTGEGAKHYVSLIHEDFLNNATKMAITRTFIHEALHAYMLSYIENGTPDLARNFPEMFSDFVAKKYGVGNASLERYQHEEIARNWVETIESSLQGLYGRPTNPNLYKYLAWGGLVGTDAFEGLDESVQQDIIALNEREDTGAADAAGDKCED